MKKTSPTNLLKNTAEIIPILENYPFPLLNPPVILIEGFESYDGNLKDEIGKSHNGIDYVRKDGNKFESFPVFSTHSGTTFQGASKTWGKFVIIQKKVNSKLRYDTIYAHFRNIDKNIPFLPKNNKVHIEGMKIKSQTFLGFAGTSGSTKRIIQLHFEMHEKNLKTGERKKIDPYGVYKKHSSNKYAQPGKSLGKFEHYFKDNFPKFGN